VCTVRNAEFPHHQGQPGHIRNGTCIPDAIAAQEELDVYTPTGNARYDSAVLAAKRSGATNYALLRTKRGGGRASSDNAIDRETTEREAAARAHAAYERAQREEAKRLDAARRVGERGE
jgi:hypothetical protein